MPDSSVNQSQFYQAMDTLREQLQENHRRQREHTDGRFNTLESMLKEHEKEDRAVEKRVTDIEAQRRNEKEHLESIARTRGLWAGIAATAGANVLIGAVKAWFGLPPSHQ